VYSRHYGAARYSVGRPRRGGFGTELRLGRIDGDAPLFERFTLGDTTTLRGWNKYAIAPAGGDRLVHQSFEYFYNRFFYFLDVGAVWTSGSERKVRLSTGIGLQATRGAFLILAAPLNADRVNPTVMLGVRYWSFGF
jgi:outer membrane protein assembly factor BamA